MTWRPSGLTRRSVRRVENRAAVSVHQLAPLRPRSAPHNGSEQRVESSAAGARPGRMRAATERGRRTLRGLGGGLPRRAPCRRAARPGAVAACPRGDLAAHRDPRLLVLVMVGDSAKRR